MVELAGVVFVVQQVCHRDLKLENTLLDGSAAPRLKICDFGYSKVTIGASVNSISTIQTRIFVSFIMTEAKKTH